jgi:AraC-like DNA-binding protein
MLFKPLPDPNNLNVLRRYLWNAETLVVHDRTNTALYRRHTAPLSLKIVRSGSESFNVHGFHETVMPGQYLVVNEDQPYESAIDAYEPVETMCVFFSQEEARDVFRLRLGDAELVDAPDSDRAKFEFPAVKRNANREVSSFTDAIITMRGAPTLARQEFSARLLFALLDHEQLHWCAQEKLDALRPATRTELYRRCLIGRAYIDALFETDITLPNIAKVAGLSRTHFLRCFTQCFGQTPYQVLRQRRLERAAELLKDRATSVTAVALAVGYNNFSAFARAFRAFYGVSPSMFEG